MNNVYSTKENLKDAWFQLNNKTKYAVIGSVAITTVGIVSLLIKICKD